MSSGERPIGAAKGKQQYRGLVLNFPRVLTLINNRKLYDRHGSGP